MKSKKIKLAINGFGRIGRAAFKIILEDFPQIEVVAINDLSSTEELAHLLKYDSCYGQFARNINFKSDSIFVDKKKYLVFNEKNPTNLPWQKLKVDIILECSGVFRTKEDLNLHLLAGAKKVILSAPPKGDKVKSFVIGVNEKSLKSFDKIISCASCTTNCLAPVMAVIKKKFGIKSSLMTTIHAYTADQNLVDGPHKDLRRARSAALNIVPTTTGAAKATSTIIPSLQGKFDGLSVRVPTPVVSLCDVVCLLNKKTDANEVNKVLTESSRKELKNIIEVSKEKLVSSDLLANPHSSIVDSLLTNVVDGNLLKLIIWYDNEWAYSKRLVELANLSFNLKK